MLIKNQLEFTNAWYGMAFAVGGRERGIEVDKTFLNTRRHLWEEQLI
jgi:hypothetical protein